jgi:arylsulfatase A-like enzyme
MSILLIITDQQRYDAVGYVNNFIKTPNLDKLAKNSVTFASCYTQSPQCHPSRASLMTGRYPSSHKSKDNTDCLSTQERVLSQILRQKTAYFGKVHLAGDNRDDRNILADLGFDYWFTYFDWIDLCKATQYKLKKFATARDEFIAVMQNKNWCGKYSSRHLHHDEVITQKAIEYIQKTTNFFVIVGYYGPHPPYASPPPYCDMYKIPPADKLRDVKSQYYGCITWLDDNIGKLLNVIDDNTTVIFTSDHGDILGDHDLFSKGFYGYEGVVRVPLLLKTPQLLPGIYSHLVQHIDLLPSLLELNGLEVPANVQGKSFISAVKNRIAYRDYTFSMIGNPSIKILRWKNYKYWIGEHEEKLFNLSKDPQEKHIINDINILAKLRAKMIQVLIETED